MRKNIIKILFIVTFLLLINSNCVLGFVKKDFKEEEILCGKWNANTSTDNILSTLKSIGYKGNSINTYMKIEAEIIINEKKEYYPDENKYKVKIKGLTKDNIHNVNMIKTDTDDKEFTIQELKDYLGYEATIVDENEKKPEVKDSWKANIIVYAPGNPDDKSKEFRNVY